MLKKQNWLHVKNDVLERKRYFIENGHVYHCKETIENVGLFYEINVVVGTGPGNTRQIQFKLRNFDYNVESAKRYSLKMLRAMVKGILTFEKERISG